MAVIEKNRQHDGLLAIAGLNHWHYGCNTNTAVPTSPFALLPPSSPPATDEVCRLSCHAQLDMV